MYTIMYARGKGDDLTRWLGLVHGELEHAVAEAREQVDADASVRARVFGADWDGRPVGAGGETRPLWCSRHWEMEVVTGPENRAVTWYATDRRGEAMADAAALVRAGGIEGLSIRNTETEKLVHDWWARDAEMAKVEQARIDAADRVLTLDEARAAASSVDGKTIRIEAAGEDVVVVARRSPEEPGGDKVILQGPRSGSIAVVGDAYCTAVRDGSGYGHAIREGRGIGGAERRGSGDGYAYCEGGMSDARRLGSGDGSAHVQGGSGVAVRTGSGRGDAYWQGHGKQRIGPAIRGGTGLGAGVVYGPGEDAPAGARRLVQEIHENLDRKFGTAAAARAREAREAAKDGARLMTLDETLRAARETAAKMAVPEPSERRGMRM